MKLLTLILGLLLCVHVNAQNKTWTFIEAGTMCSILSTDSLDITEHETVGYSIAFIYSSKEHELNEHLRSINLKTSEYVLQFNLSIYRPADVVGFLGEKIDIPVELKVDGSLLEANENEYNTTYYMRGENAKRILQKLVDRKKISAYVIIGNSEYLIPVTTFGENIDLKLKLLQACENYFV
ncbi:hypothetical protein [Aliiglaciecola sp. NS0011-25]|uniref:hypothetical protein n=1 Tax=Aliiglaciecola sp. NS0011-25 TaxID=3127654 RepID=UPI00310B417B